MGPAKSKISRKASSDSASQTRQSGVRIEPQTGDDADQDRQSECDTKPQTGDITTTASQPRNDTPLQNPSAPPKTPPSDLAILPLLRASGRITQTEYLVYKYFHTRNKNKSHSATTTTTTNATITFSHPTPDAVRRVFNTAELLEMILLYLPPGYLYAKAQLACRGFKNAMQASPTFQRLLAGATRGVYSTPSFAWGIPLKCFDSHYAVGERLVLRLTFTDLSFERHLFCERVRRFPVSDTAPLRLEVLWYEGEEMENLLARCESCGSVGYQCGCLIKISPNRMVYMSSKTTAGQHERITFGRIFDAVARRVPVGVQVGGMVVVLTQDRHTFCGPLVADGTEESLRRRSA